MEVYCPTLALAECAAAIARQTNDPYLARELVGMNEDFPGIKLISLDLSMARKAAEILSSYEEVLRMLGMAIEEIKLLVEIAIAAIAYLIVRCGLRATRNSPTSYHFKQHHKLRR